ncbi:MAG TPA: sugar kinase [Saprospiraceae bacterium]|nr:sugar kinase [Saprospiraceae bacterium]HNT21161.1 sugar kinase [Saprospiraceae bacterium]
MNRVICFGEIMLRLTPFMHQRLEQSKSFNMDFGGSESNVSAGLAQLGIPVAYVSRVPDSPLGKSALSSLAQWGVDTSVSVLGGDRLGIYFVELGAGRRPSRVIYDRKQSGMHSLKPGMIDWNVVFRGAAWFHWSGITPSLSASAAAATLEAINAAREAGLLISCDLNYRTKLWKYGAKPSEIMPALIEATDVIVGDEDVLDAYFGLKTDGIDDAFSKLSHRFPNLKYMVLTDRKGLTASHFQYHAYLYCNGRTYESQKYELPDVIDRIGSGDAFMSGLICKLLPSGQNPPDLQKAIEFATACGVYKHYIPGDLNIFTESDIVSLMEGSTGGKVGR